MSQEGIEIIDHTVLDTIRALSGDDGADLLTQIIDIFLKDTPTQLDNLAKAAAGHDLESIRAIAHSMKSGSANLGAMRLSACFKELEQASRDRNMTDVPDLIQRIRGEWDRLFPHLIRIKAANQ